MTPQKTLKRIEKQRNEFGFNGNLYVTVEEYSTIKQALEKQIPKKPIAEKNEIDTLDDYFCPYCRSFLDEKPKCCDTCGQALDWSE